MKLKLKKFELTAKIIKVWNGYAKKFDSLEEAERWLHTEEYDFRTRSLVSKTYAKRYL